jgi:cell surface protein SprA
MNLNGGDLYFNLGNISEDVLKDGRKSFENGLPSTAEVTHGRHYGLGTGTPRTITGLMLLITTLNQEDTRTLA